MIKDKFLENKGRYVDVFDPRKVAVQIRLAFGLF